MRAIILSAGFGKRLLPLTASCPKPLLKIGNETLLSNTIKFLERFGVKQIVINVHYLKNQIIKYINENDFNLDIKIITEKDEILDTGGGVLNAIEYFSNKPFLVINPDTIWNEQYLPELEIMKKIFFEKENNKCLLLVVNKNKSFDKSFSGDFTLENNLIKRENKNNLSHVYTGLQIIEPKIFSNIKTKIFSMNQIWNNLILKNQLSGFESNIDFLHVSTLNVYEKLIKKIKY